MQWNQFARIIDPHICLDFNLAVQNGLRRQADVPLNMFYNREFICTIFSTARKLEFSYLFTLPGHSRVNQKSET